MATRMISARPRRAIPETDVAHDLTDVLAATDAASLHIVSVVDPMVDNSDLKGIALAFAAAYAADLNNSRDEHSTVAAVLTENEMLAQEDTLSNAVGIGYQVERAIFSASFKAAWRSEHYAECAKILACEVVKGSLVRAALSLIRGFVVSPVEWLANKVLQSKFFTRLTKMVTGNARAARIATRATQRVLCAACVTFVIGLCVNLLHERPGASTKTLLTKTILETAAIALLPLIASIPLVDAIAKVPSLMQAHRAQGGSLCGSFVAAVRDWILEVPVIDWILNNVHHFFLSRGYSRDLPEANLRLMEDAMSAYEDAHELDFHVHPELLCPITLTLVKDPVSVHGILMGRAAVTHRIRWRIRAHTGEGRPNVSHPAGMGTFITEDDIKEPSPQVASLHRQYRVARVHAFAAWRPVDPR